MGNSESVGKSSQAGQAGGNSTADPNDAASHGALKPYLSPLAAVALSFGYAVGWSSFVMPGTTFLPCAGPLGTVLGVLGGAIAMMVIAWSYHRMTVDEPGPGGTFAFTRKCFGCDHAFLVSWFMCLAYIAVLWANASALVLLARYTLGDFFQFGFKYTLVGFDIYLGEALLSGAAILACGLVAMFRKHLTATLQTVLAICLFGGAAIVVGAAVWRHTGGFAAMAPAFAEGSSPVSQVFRILAMMPWAFVGFEAISNSSGEFKFPVKRSFSILSIAVLVSTFVYAALAVLPTMAFPETYAHWTDYIKDLPNLQGIASMPVFTAAKMTLGAFGTAVIILAMIGGLFTGIIASYVAMSRLMYAMAEDDILPKWFRRVNADGTPANAMLAVMLVSLVIPFLGRSVIWWPVDVASIGVAIAFCYTAAAAIKTAAQKGERLTVAGGVAGVVMSIFIGLLLLVPNYLSGSALAPESYLVLALWCILGFLYYRRVFSKDATGRYGQSIVAWAALIVVIVFASLMWVRQTANNATETLLANVANDAHGIDILEKEIQRVNSSLLANSIVEMCLIVASLAIMISVYAILRHREKDMAVAKSKAEEVNRAKSFFFSSVSHDIRTPLNAIIGFSQMLKSGFKTKEETTEAIDSILVSSKTLLSLINDVLDFSKLESGRMEILPEPTDCRKLVEELVKSFRIASNKPNVEIRSSIGEIPPLMLDPQRIRQIVFNLVGNASKFTKEGHIEVRASFTRNRDDSGAELDTGAFRLDVEDTGPGISAEDQQKIAQPYAQFGNRMSRSMGTGLGLAICRQLAVAMGGELTLKSELGKGSTFTILLPEVQITEMPKTLDAVPPPEHHEAESAKLPVRRTLIVDDQKMNLMVLKAMLSRMGKFEIVTAMNGREAMDTLTRPGEPPFDLVLTDMWMPQLDGEGLVREIRATPALAELPVYVLTADIEAQKTYADMGFTGLLLKPVTIEDLKTIL